MSTDWLRDMREMHAHYGVHAAVDRLTADELLEFLKFRIKFLKEELTELESATDAEDVVDALIDLAVVDIGTIDLFAIDGYKAWDEVLKSNLAKRVGVKPNRPNPLGLPDLIKPDGWVGPSHAGNHGKLTAIDLFNQSVDS